MAFCARHIVPIDIFIIVAGNIAGLQHKRDGPRALLLPILPTEQDHEIRVLLRQDVPIEAHPAMACTSLREGPTIDQHTVGL